MSQTKEKVLQLLEQARGESFSGQQLAQSLGVSRAAIWKAVSTLKQEGHAIEGIRNKGYCMAPNSDVLTLSALTPWLPPEWDSSLLHVHDQVESTNITAKLLAAQGAPQGTCVLAAHQTGGRGRRGRSFFSPTGGVYLSMVLRPQMPAEQSTRITTAAAVQVCKAIETTCGLQPTIKWVNDLLLDGKKICGILTEASLDLETGMPEYVILGVGINLQAPPGGFPPEIAHIAGALYQAPPPGMTRGRLAAALVRNLQGIADLCQQESIIEEYRRRCPLVGQDIWVMTAPPCPGRVLGITDTCGLLVGYPDGRQEELQSGEVSIRPHNAEGWNL